jgi:hypothetical protein
MDGSMLVNTGLQQYLGYRPYSEIVNGLPPLFVLGAGVAFRVWGLHYSSTVILLAFFVPACMIFEYWLLRKLAVPWLAASVFAFVTQAMPQLPSTYWWYNPITESVAILFVLAFLLFIRQPSARLPMFALWATATALLLAKPNIAGLLILLAAGIGLLAKPLRRNTILLLGAAGVTALLILFAARASPFDLWHSYRIVSARVTQLGKIWDFLYRNQHWEVVITAVYGVPALLALFEILRSWPKFAKDSANHWAAWQRTASAALAFGAMVVAFVGTATNNSANLQEAPLALCGLGILLWTNWGTFNYPRSPAPVLFWLSAALWASESLFICVNRFGIAEVGPGAFFEVAPLVKLTAPGFFEGMSVGPRFVRTMDDIRKTLDGYRASTGRWPSVLFGPRMEFGYAAYSIRPPKGLPILWEAFEEDSPASREMVRRFEEANFDMCIMLHNDYVFYPRAFREYLSSAYDTRQIGELTVHTRK